MQMRARLLFIAVLALLACRTARSDNEQRLSLHGIVLDSATGAPVFAALVRLEDSQWGSRTDSAGRYALRAIPSGTYAISVSGPCTQNVRVARSSVQLVDTAAVWVSFRIPLDSANRQCRLTTIRVP
jgi:hypothetical protein